MQGVLSFGAFVVTNFSSLRTGQKELQTIPKTEDRGIRVSEKTSKLVHGYSMIQSSSIKMYCSKCLSPETSTRDSPTMLRL